MKQAGGGKGKLAPALASASDQSGKQCKGGGKREKGKDIKQLSETREFSETQCDGGLMERDDFGQLLGRGRLGQFCLPCTSPSQSYEAEGKFGKDKDAGQPLGRSEFCLPCTSLAPALLGRILCRKLPSGAILQAEVTPVQQKLSRHLAMKNSNI